MNLNEVRRLLSDLEKLVGGWNSVSEISAIERDLALGKLAAIYDALRFGGGAVSAPAEAVEPEVVPVPIDLGELLAPGYSEAEVQPEEVEFPFETVAESVGAAVPEYPVTKEVAPAIAPVSETVGSAAPIEPEPVPEPAPEPAPEPEPTPTPDPEPAEEPQPKAPEASYVAPTLFGPEEAFVRHRHKQRVIMSLYDTDSAGTRFEKRPAAPAPAPVSETPNVSESPKTPEAPKPSEEPDTPAAPQFAAPIPASVEEIAEARNLAMAVLVEETPQPEPPVAEPDEPDDEPIAGEPAAPEVPIEAAPEKGHAPESVFERLAAAKAEAEAQKAAETAAADSEPVAEPEDSEVIDNEVPASELSAAPSELSAAAAEEVEEPFEVIFTESETPADPEPEYDSEPEYQPEPAPSPVSEYEPELESAPIPDPDPLPAGTVLGEVMNHDVRTIADTIAPARDIASALGHGRVTELRRAIGLNDKFLLIRDLFGGDAAAYEQTLTELDAFDDFDDCMIHIAENYAWNPDSDGARLLMELLERKFA